MTDWTHFGGRQRRAVAAGWSALRPRLRAAMQRLRRSAIVLPLAVAGALLVIGVSETAYQSATASLSRLRDRDLAQGKIQGLLRSLIDAESGQRGYLLTGRKDHLQPYHWAVADVDSALKSLASHYRNDAAVAPIVAQLSERINEKLSEVETTIELFEQGRHDAWRELMLSNIGKEKMDAIREAATALLDIESGRIVEQRRQVFATLNLGRIGVGVLLLLGLAALALYLRQSAAVLAAQRDHQAALRGERDRLEDEVMRRTAELTELTRHLQTAREDERSRLARELHDELGALLTAAKLDVARLKRSLAAHDAASADRLAHLAETLNSGIALKRRIIEDLRPSALSNLGLVAALQAQARDFGQRGGIEMTVELQDVQLADSAQITVYRLVQEALTNIAKHAQATRVWLGLRTDEGQVLVSVRDDGRGFDAKALPPSTHGLTGMRYRVEAEGGTMRVRATPGRGTLIEASLPARQR